MMSVKIEGIEKVRKALEDMGKVAQDCADEMSKTTALWKDAMQRFPKHEWRQLYEGTWVGKAGDIGRGVEGLWEREMQLAREKDHMTTFTGQDMTLTIDGKIFNGMVTSSTIHAGHPVTSHWKGYRGTECHEHEVVGYTETTGSLEFIVSTVAENTGEWFSTPEYKYQTDEVREENKLWDNLRDYVEKGFDGHVSPDDGKTWYEIKKLDKKTNVVEDTNMKKVYFLYAVNRKTEALFSKGPLVGSRQESEAKTALSLEYADDLKALGDPADLDIWVEEVGAFEPIED